MILSDMLLAFTIFIERSMIFELSIPITCLAPALVAKDRAFQGRNQHLILLYLSLSACCVPVQFYRSAFAFHPQAFPHGFRNEHRGQSSITWTSFQRKISPQHHRELRHWRKPSCATAVNRNATSRPWPPSRPHRKITGQTTMTFGPVQFPMSKLFSLPRGLDYRTMSGPARV